MSTSPSTGWKITRLGQQCVLGKFTTEVKKTIHLNLIFRITDNDGRAKQFLTKDQFAVGTYRVHFDTKPYFDVLGVKTFYPYVEVMYKRFIIKPLSYIILSNFTFLLRLCFFRFM